MSKMAGKEKKQPSSDNEVNKFVNLRNVDAIEGLSDKDLEQWISNLGIKKDSPEYSELKKIVDKLRKTKEE